MWLDHFLFLGHFVKTIAHPLVLKKKQMRSGSLKVVYKLCKLYIKLQTSSRGGYYPPDRREYVAKVKKGPYVAHICEKLAQYRPGGSGEAGEVSASSLLSKIRDSSPF